MAKFALIYTKSRIESELKRFDKKYTSKYLKKLFKCEGVYEISRYGKEVSEIGKMTRISRQVIADMQRNMGEEFNDYCFDEGELIPRSSKLFAFSKDAASTAFAFEVLMDGGIKFFELNQKSASELNEKLSKLRSKSYDYQKLDEASDLLESLIYIENELGLSLTYSRGDEEIEEKREEWGYEIDELKMEVREAIDSNWRE